MYVCMYVCISYYAYHIIYHITSSRRAQNQLRKTLRSQVALVRSQSSQIIVQIVCYIVACYITLPDRRSGADADAADVDGGQGLKIHQSGVQRKQGVVIYMVLHTCLLYHATPIHCTPLPTHTPVKNTQGRNNTIDIIQSVILSLYTL